MMMKRQIIAILAGLLFMPFISKAFNDNPAYSIDNIPENLFINSHTIVREHEMKFTIVDEGNSRLKVKVVKTILNKKGDHNNALTVFYDKFVSINSLSGKLYDRNGKYIRKLKNSDIEDYSAVSSFSIYEDSRVKHARIFYSDYPYTVEFEYEVTKKSMLYYPGWSPVNTHSISVENSSFVVEAASNFDFRYREYNLEQPAQVSISGGIKTHTWQIKNFQGFEYESNMPEMSEVFPRVYLAPNRFDFDGIPGDGSTWKSLGEFIWKLNNGRDEIPETVKSDLRELTSGLNSDKEKIKAIYQYLQNTTRYVSIQLGIGGFQPFTAEYVKQNGYGDCKALTNYMYSLLKSIGIPSVYTLVKAGDDEPDIKYDFPMNQFNHVILCVPNKGDTVWLECTSQTNPFGYLGTFTMDRHVLFITKEGGKIGKTPSFGYDKNLQYRKGVVKLFENGSANSNVVTNYSGLQYENVSWTLNEGKEEQKKFIYESVDLPSFELKDFAFSCDKSPYPKAEQNLELEIRRFATVSGQRIFFQPNLMNRQSKMDKPMKERKFDLELTFPYLDIDTIVYNIPENYHLEFLPGEINIKSDFGSYYSKVIQQEGQVIYIRERKKYEGIYSAEKYNDFVKFMNDIAEADKQKLVLVKET